MAVTQTVWGGGVWIAPGVHRKKWTWGATSVSGYSDMLSAAQLPHKTVVISGPTGGTTNVRVEGAQFPSGPWITLTSATGAALSLNSAIAGAMYVLHENPAFIRGRASTVTTSASGRPDIEITSTRWM
jgi:hypothetical protein